MNVLPNVPKPKKNPAIDEQPPFVTEELRREYYQRSKFTNLKYGRLNSMRKVICGSNYNFAHLFSDLI